MVNEATLSLITEFEGLRLNAYADPAHGWKVPTIGVGHTSAAGPPAVVKGMKITKAEAMEILQRDLSRVEAAVRSLVKVPVDANQFGALVSFTFNLGEGNLKKSTLLKKLNAGDYAGAGREFARWNRAGGKVMAGLTRRRAAEAALFAAPVGLRPSATNDAFREVMAEIVRPAPRDPATPAPPEPETPAPDAPTQSEGGIDGLKVAAFAIVFIIGAFIGAVVF